MEIKYFLKCLAFLLKIWYHICVEKRHKDVAEVAQW